MATGCHAQLGFGCQPKFVRTIKISGYPPFLSQAILNPHEWVTCQARTCCIRFIKLEPLYHRDALDHIAERPGWWPGPLVRKAFHTILPFGPSHAVHSTRYRVASAASYLAVLPFAVAGAGRLWSSARRPAALFLLAASGVLSCLVFFPQERYRIPEIDPTLIDCAGALAGRVRP